jgi:hypothetical protein
MNAVIGTTMHLVAADVGDPVRPRDELGWGVGQRRVALLDRLGPVVIGVVPEQGIHAVEAEPSQALLDRAEHAVPAEIPHPAVGRGNVETLVVAPAVATAVWHEEPAHRRGHDELVTWPAAQRSAESPLGQPEPVARSGVEIPRPGIPCRVDGLLRVSVAGRPMQVADGCTTK